MLAHTDAATGKPFVDIVLDQAEQKGTGRWTVQSALDLGIPITGIAEATFARSLSGHADQREAARRAFADAGEKWPVERPGRRSSRTCGARCCASQDRRVRAGLRPHPRPAARSTTGTSTWAAPPRSGGAAASSGPASSNRIREAYDERARPADAAGGAVVRRRGQRRRAELAAGGGRRGPGGRADPGVLVVAGVLRRAARGAAAGRADPGPAGQLRRAHLPAGGPRGHLPHRLGRPTAPSRPPP